VTRRKPRQISTGRLQSLRLFSTLLAFALTIRVSQCKDLVASSGVERAYTIAMSRVLPLLLAIVLSCLAAEAQQKPCSHAESLQVEDEAEKLRTWEVLYKSYGLYARCNNVDAEEGYSESVARILVDY
jgi:hypothetical protein